MSDDHEEITRIQNAPMEEREEMLMDFIKRKKQECPESIACISELPQTAINVKELKMSWDPAFPFGPIPHWIKCSERLPEINQRVLVYQNDGVHGGNEIDIDYRTEDHFWNEQGCHCDITHWMPLPELPHE